MRYIALSILFTAFLATKSFGQDNTVRDLLLGNNPEAAFKPGIGQIIQPLVIQTPIVNPLTGQTRGAQPAPVLPPSKTATKGLEKEFKYKTVYDYYEKDSAKDRLGELGPKKSTDPKVLRREAIQRMILSNEIAGAQENNLATATAAKRTKRKVIEIPYADPPKIKTVPYNR